MCNISIIFYSPNSYKDFDYLLKSIDIMIDYSDVLIVNIYTEKKVSVKYLKI